MKAIVFDEFGPPEVLRLAEVERPVPGDDEVLIRIRGLVRRKKTRLLLGKASHPDLIFLAELLEAGRIRTVIDRRYPLAETAEAVRYVNEGQARGKVVITVSSDAAR